MSSLSGIKNAFQFKGEAKRGLGFRKFYKTQAEESGMKSINVEVAHGHSIGVSGHYYRPKPSDILQDYMTHAVDALTISSEHRLKKRNEELETGQAQEIAMLKEKLKSYDKTLAIHEEYYERSEKTFAEASKLIEQLGRAYMGLDDPKRLKHIEKHIDKINDLPPALRIVVLEALKDKHSQGSD